MRSSRTLNAMRPRRATPSGAQVGDPLRDLDHVLHRLAAEWRIRRGRGETARAAAIARAIDERLDQRHALTASPKPPDTAD
jgi:hypothetical protein